MPPRRRRHGGSEEPESKSLRPWLDMSDHTGPSLTDPATIACNKELQNRSERQLEWSAVHGNPKSGRFRKSKASLKRWIANRQLARCLSRYDRRRKNGYKWEEKRQNSLLARLRPSLSKRISNTVASATKAMNALESIVQNANNKLTQVEVNNAKQLVSTTEGLLSKFSDKIKDVDPQHVDDLLTAITSAMNKFVENKGGIKTELQFSSLIPSMFRRAGGSRSAYGRRKTTNRKRKTRFHL